MEKISNYNIYTEAMQKTLLDKIWFLDKLPPEVNTIVDFGCADGSLFKFIETLFPNRFLFIGIDNDEHMRTEARKNLFNLFANNRVMIIENIECLTKDYAKTAVLVMNSFIHELFTYCNYQEVKKTLKIITELNFKYIAIRDMHEQNNIDTNAIDFLRKAYMHKRFHWWNEWKKQAYFTDSNENLVIEYLLKYRYKENWSREVTERYLWNWKPTLVNAFEYYTPIVEIDFSLPFVFEQFEKDFECSLPFAPFNTHKKMLFKLND